MTNATSVTKMAKPISARRAVRQLNNHLKKRLMVDRSQMLGWSDD
jgi:hypothetical protein